MLPDLPGWDSLPAVTRYHNWAEMAGIVVVALLVITEIAAYKYGHRKDDLTDHQQTATNQRHDEEMARLHLETAKITKDAEIARAAIADANARALEAQAQLEKFKAPRTLNAEQQARIVDKLKPFPGQEYALSVGSGREATDFLCLLDKLLVAAKWKRQPPTLPITVDTPCGTVGVNTLSAISVRVKPDATGPTVSAAEALLTALRAEDVQTDGARDPKNIPSQTIVQLMVGQKP